MLHHKKYHKYIIFLAFFLLSSFFLMFGSGKSGIYLKTRAFELIENLKKVGCGPSNITAPK